MKVLRLFLILLILQNSLFSSIYIQIASTKSKNNLRNAKERLKRLNVNMLYKQSKDVYTIYSGPYKDEISAMHDIQRMKPYFPHAATVIIGAKQEDSQEDDTYTSTTSLKSGFNMGISLGYNQNSPSYDGNTSVVLPKNSGLSYSLEMGYGFDNGLLLTVGYALLGTSDISVSNIYGSINYQYANTTNYIPYLGLLGGMSTMTWNTSPLTTTTQSITGSSSPLYGLQTGVSYNGFESFQIFTGYQLMLVDHSLQIDSTGSAIKHTMIHNLQFGIRYYF